MPYAFKVTAKQNIGGSKGIAKGMSVQCVEKSISSPQILMTYMNRIMNGFSPFSLMRGGSRKMIISHYSPLKKLWRK